MVVLKIMKPPLSYIRQLCFIAAHTNILRVKMNSRPYISLSRQGNVSYMNLSFSGILLAGGN